MEETKATTEAEIPKGNEPQVKGWCWGAFSLTWIWAFFMRPLEALLMFVPFLAVMTTVAYFIKPGVAVFLYLVVAVVFGALGRKWAWARGGWKSVQDFNWVQMAWGIIGCFFMAAMVGQYRTWNDCKVSGNSRAQSDLRNLKTVLDNYFDVYKHFPSSISELNYQASRGVQVDCAITATDYVCVSAHKEEGSREYFVCYSSPRIYWRNYKKGTTVRAHRNWNTPAAGPPWLEL